MNGPTRSSRHSIQSKGKSRGNIFSPQNSQLGLVSAHCLGFYGPFASCLCLTFYYYSLLPQPELFESILKEVGKTSRGHVKVFWKIISANCRIKDIHFFGINTSRKNPTSKIRIQRAAIWPSIYKISQKTEQHLIYLTIWGNKEGITEADIRKDVSLDLKGCFQLNYTMYYCNVLVYLIAITTCLMRSNLFEKGIIEACCLREHSSSWPRWHGCRNMRQLGSRR